LVVFAGSCSRDRSGAPLCAVPERPPIDAAHRGQRGGARVEA